jgi:ribosome maturation factor RimP
MGSDRSIERWMEARLEDLGYELVELERAGDEARPIFRLRIDRAPGSPEEGITHGDCVTVSRALEPDLDARADVSPRYLLDVSSPGIERPLVRRRDWDRFAGRTVAVRTTVPIEGRGKRVEGDLVGVVGDGGAERVRLQCGEEVVEIPLDGIQRANLVHSWDSEGR